MLAVPEGRSTAPQWLRHDFSVETKMHTDNGTSFMTRYYHRSVINRELKSNLWSLSHCDLGNYEVDVVVHAKQMGETDQFLHSHLFL